ncbi:MAG TPA: hypothetical protein VJS92_04420 [Candidatus Polarisedimenticolaceae bacterium]|nr:hypothetical protein [Candidatus Polarisedimenticolaceae bacterium]
MSRRGTTRFLAWTLLLAAPSLRSGRGPERAAELPLRFERTAAGFAARAGAFDVEVRPNALTLRRPARGELRWEIVGARPGARLSAERPLRGPTQRLDGGDRRAYAAVRVREVYPGIDFVVSGGAGHLDYRFVVGAGADSRSVALAAPGGGGLRRELSGTIVTVGAGAAPADPGLRLAADAAGRIYVGSDRWVGRLSASGRDFDYVTQLDGAALGELQALAVDAEDRLVLAGTTGLVIVLDPDGKTVAHTSQLAGELRALAPDAAGGVWVAGGSFVVHLDAAGTTRRETPVDGPVRALALDAGGAVVVAGDRFLARLSPEGEPQSLVPLDPALQVRGLAVDLSGRTLLAGRRIGSGPCVTRLGGACAPLDGSGDGEVRALAVGPDGAIYAVGSRGSRGFFVELSAELFPRRQRAIGEVGEQRLDAVVLAGPTPWIGGRTSSAELPRELRLLAAGHGDLGFVGPLGVGSADLALTKTASPDPVDSGSTLTFNLDVANTGPDPATAVTVTDSLPAGTLLQAAAGSGWSCGETGGTVTCTRAALAVGQAPTIAVRVIVLAGGGTLDNTASVTALETDPDPSDDDGSVQVGVTPIADLAIVKTDAPDPVTANGSLTYTLSVTNAGPSTASALVVRDVLPGTVRFQSVAGSGWSCGQNAGTVTCTLDSLPPGPAAPITIDVGAPGTGPLSNTASVQSATADRSPTDNTATATTAVNPVADLAIQKTDASDPAAAGVPLAYTLQVTNNGPSAASDVEVTDRLPAGLGFVSASGTGWTCSEDTGTVVCGRAGLAPGPAPAITLTVTTPATSGTVDNTASVASGTTDPQPANDADSESTAIVAAADLALVKSDGPDPVRGGQLLTYTIAVTNSGPSAATALTVSDPLPAGTTLVGATGTGWACGEAAGTVTCTRGSLAVGAAPPITIQVTAPAAGGTLTNQATVGAAQLDSDPADNTGSAGTTVLGSGSCLDVSDLAAQVETLPLGGVERARLLVRLDAAERYVQANSNFRAIQQLEKFRAALLDLASQGAVDDADAESVLACLDDVVAEIGSVSGKPPAPSNGRYGFGGARRSRTP